MKRGACDGSPGPYRDPLELHPAILEGTSHDV
jgi:hypothetical protein